MKNLYSSILLATVFASLVLVFQPSPVKADAQAPFSTISVGDWWKYNLQDSASGISGTVTQTLAGSVVLDVNGVATPCYKGVLSGSGTFTSSGVTGTFTMSGTGYVRESDLGSVNSNVTVIIAAGITLTQITYSNNSLPVPPYQFPLYVGRTWVNSYFTTTKTTTYTSVNPTPTVTTSQNYTSQLYSVTGSSVISVTAGSYLAYDIHSVNVTGTDDQYYSPQVENVVKDVSYYPNGTVESTTTLQAFNAWPYQSSLKVAKNGSDYNVGIFADATISGVSSNTTAITFQVNATSGTSGRSNVTIQKGLNSTVVKVYVDNSPEALTVTQNSTDDQVYFTFSLSTHTVTLVYAANPSGIPWTTYLIFGGIGAAAAALIIATLLILRRRERPAPTESVPPAPPSPLPGPTPAPTNRFGAKIIYGRFRGRFMMFAPNPRSQMTTEWTSSRSRPPNPNPNRV